MKKLLVFNNVKLYGHRRSVYLRQVLRSRKCNKKRECGTNSSYNVDNCTDVCSDSANANDEYARKVNSCKECVEPLSCGDYKVASCLPNCLVSAQSDRWAKASSRVIGARKTRSQRPSCR